MDLHLFNSKRDPRHAWLHPHCQRKSAARLCTHACACPFRHSLLLISMQPKDHIYWSSHAILHCTAEDRPPCTPSSRPLIDDLISSTRFYGFLYHLFWLLALHITLDEYICVSGFFFISINIPYGSRHDRAFTSFISSQLNTSIIIHYCLFHSKFVTLAKPLSNRSLLLLHAVSLQFQFTFYKLFYAADVEAQYRHECLSKVQTPIVVLASLQANDSVIYSSGPHRTRRFDLCMMEVVRHG